jgi:DNA-directed RNA polymerase specialized sigma24 family protein
MSSEGSVTGWLGELQGGNQAAAQQLWEHFFARMVGLARQRLRGVVGRGVDEEDVALSAFHSFCRNAEGGKFPGLLDRDSLWRLLVVITARKAAHFVRDETRLKRGGNRAAGAGHDPGNWQIEGLLSREPSPEFTAQFAEECNRLLEKLGDPQLAQVALWRMEGHTVEEIAVKLQAAPRTVKRKLQLIRELWETELPV